MAPPKKGGAAKRKAAAKAANAAKKQKLDEQTDPDAKIERKEVDLTKVNLQDQQYAEAWTEPAPKELPPRQERWRYEGDGEMIDKAKLPKGWNSLEPDLDPDDVDAQITRCQERIEDKIMPFVFKARMDLLKKKKAAQEKTKEGEPADLPLNVYLRINELKRIEESLAKTEDSDPFEQLPNVKALLAGYREGRLIWRQGLVTYWSKGKQLSQPRPFDWDEFEAINKANEGNKAFWVEGKSGPGTTPMLATMMVPKNATGRHTYDIALRLPNVEWWCQFPFLADTGAASMTINDADMQAMYGPYGAMGEAANFRILSHENFTGFTGDTVSMPVIEVEACILNAEGRRMTAWHRIQTAVIANNAVGDDRLDGPFGRYILYSAYQPDNQYELRFSTSKSGLNLTTVDLAAAPPQIPPIIHNTAPSQVAADHPLYLGAPLPARAPGAP